MRYSALMYKNTLIAGVILLVALSGLWYFLKKDDTGAPVVQDTAADAYEVDASDYYTPDLSGAPGALSAEEIQWVLFMREEEKLARDVYQVLGERWELNLFANIARSEQSHMDAVGVLIARYALEDPVQEEVGVFTSPELGELYQILVEEGSVSVESALQVGAEIEDLDISDLNEALAVTTAPDVRTVYANLQKGSRNHLRAFTKNIISRGGTYAPQYITQEAYDAIIAGAQERGRVEAR